MDTAGRISVFPSVTTSHSLSISRCLAQLPPSQAPEFALCLADDSLDNDVLVKRSSSVNPCILFLADLDFSTPQKQRMDVRI
jgi:hypothetical protein